MQAKLTWPEARGLALTGANVRRAQWADRWIFAPRGVLFWLETMAGTRRIVQAGDFQRPEFLARDWTDAAPDQNKCVGLPPLDATLALSPTSVSEGGTSTATLSIPVAQTEDARFAVSTGPRGRAVHVAEVTIPAGDTQVSFSIEAIDVDLPSAVIVSAVSNVFGLAQAILDVVGVVAPPPPVPVVYSRGENWVAPGVGFGYGPGRAGGRGAFIRLYGWVVTNPFSSPATIEVSGTARDRLMTFDPDYWESLTSAQLLVGNYDPLRGTQIYGAPGVRWVVAGGARVGLFAIANGSHVFEPTGYNYTVSFTP